MMKWNQKAMIYNLFSMMPKGETLFEAIRMKFGSLGNFDVTVRLKSVDKMAYMLAETQKAVEGEALVEIGSGWHPMLPALFHGMGASAITMTDINPHIRNEAVAKTLECLICDVDKVSELISIDAETLRNKWRKLLPGTHDWQDVWREHGITYRAPFDFSNCDLESDSIGVIYSNSCLGYVPVSVLQGIFSEAERVLRTGGIMLHRITTYDDYAGTDRSITPINFLKFNEKQWARRGNSSMHFQNRRRPDFYESLAKENGFIIRLAERLSEHIQPEMLQREALDQEFRDLPEEELLCAHLLLVAEKAS